MNPLIASPTALRDSGNPETHAAMLALAEQLLAGREGYRDHIAGAGKPISLAVEASISLARALVEQWRWVVDASRGALPDPDWPTGWWGAWPQELAADTATAADRARQRAVSGDLASIEMAERCEVLAWYQFVEPGRWTARIVWDVDRERCRAARAADRREAA